MDYEKFIAQRITELRMKKGISEYKMSIDMGHSSSYINSIASGKALPSMKEFLYICEYLGVTPEEFFNTNMPNAQLIQRIYQLSLNLSETDLTTLIGLAERFHSK